MQLYTHNFFPYMYHVLDCQPKLLFYVECNNDEHPTWVLTVNLFFLYLPVSSVSVNAKLHLSHRHLSSHVVNPWISGRVSLSSQTHSCLFFSLNISSLGASRLDLSPPCPLIHVSSSRLPPAHLLPLPPPIPTSSSCRQLGGSQAHLPATRKRGWGEDQVCQWRLKGSYKEREQSER